MKPLISVIIPAYNAEHTICKCVKSILNQTYTYLEVIVVNDGSIDATESIVKKIADEDNRVKLITISNQGVSHARNVGIDCAKGDYLTFVDSDDYIDKEMYSSLLQLSDKYHVKIAHCSYKNVTETGDLISIVGNQGLTVVQNHDDAIRCIIESRLFTGGIWNKIYARDLFEQTRLDEKIKINEDILLNFQLFDQVDKSVYCDLPLYNYVCNKNSSSHTTSFVQKGEQALYVSRLILDLSMNHTYQKSAEKRLAGTLLGLYGSYLFDQDHDNRIKIQAVKQELAVYKKRKLLSGKKDIMKYYFFRFAPALYNGLFPLYDKFRVIKLDPEQKV